MDSESPSTPQTSKNPKSRNNKVFPDGSKNSEDSTSTKIKVKQGKRRESKVFPENSAQDDNLATDKPKKKQKRLQKKIFSRIFERAKIENTLRKSAAQDIQIT